MKPCKVSYYNWIYLKVEALEIIHRIETDIIKETDVEQRIRRSQDYVDGSLNEELKVFCGLCILYIISFFLQFYKFHISWNLALCFGK
jgi:hypothetical protein